MKIAHDRRGSGAPLVLIHGIGSRRGVWDPVIDRLAAEREVLALDLPGFAESPPLPGGRISTVDSLADAVEGFLATEGLDRPHVAGNSLGGGIALVLARRGSVRSATALSPVGFWREPEIRYAVTLLKASRLTARALRPAAPRLLHSAAMRTAFFGHIFARPARLSPDTALADLDAFLAAPAFDETLENTRHWHFRDPGRVEVPVTIAWGRKDRLLLPRQAERARDRLAQANHVWLEGCGHVPMPDDPEQVAALLLEGSRETPVAVAAASNGAPA